MMMMISQDQETALVWLMPNYANRSIFLVTENTRRPLARIVIIQFSRHQEQE
jgi:hypothetical protein